MSTPAGQLTVQGPIDNGILDLQALGPDQAKSNYFQASLSAQPAGALVLSFPLGDFEAEYTHGPCPSVNACLSNTVFKYGAVTPIDLSASDAAVRQGGFDFSLDGHSALTGYLGGTLASTYGWELILTGINASGQSVTILDQNHLDTVNASGAQTVDLLTGSLGKFSLTGHLNAGFDLNTLQVSLRINPQTSLTPICPSPNADGTCPMGTYQQASSAIFGDYTVLLDKLTLIPSSSAVPEPGTLALMGLGLIGLSLASSRRRR